MNVIQDLYEHEINCSVLTFFDAGYKVQIGDPWNGYKATAELPTWAEAEAWLLKTAMEHYPGFAEKHKGDEK